MADESRTSSVSRWQSAALMCVLLVAGVVPLASGTWSLFLGITMLYDENVWPRVIATALFALASVGCAFMAARTQGAIRVSRAGLLWLPLLGWFALATAVGVEPITSLVGTYERGSGLIDWLLYATVFAAVVLAVDSPAAIRRVLWVVLAAGALLSVYGLVQYIGLDPVEWFVHEGRAFSLLGNPDDLAGYLLFPLGAGLALIFTEKTRVARLAVAVTSALCSAALYVTFTRAGWIGIAVTVAFFVIAVRSRLRTLDRDQYVLLGAAAVTFSALVVFSLITGQGVTDPAERLAVSGATANSVLSGRPLIWETAIRGAAARPVVGWGPSSLGLIYHRFRPEQETLTADDPHNIVLEGAVDGGLPGAFALLALLGALLYQPLAALRGKDPEGRRLLVLGPLAAVIGYLVYRLAGPGNIASEVNLWLALGLCQVPFARRRTVSAGLATAVAVVAGLAVIASGVLGTRALAADSYYVSALETSGTAEQFAAKQQLAERATRLNPTVADYASTAAMAQGNLWMARNFAAGATPDRASYDKAEAALADVTRRFGNDPVHWLNLARFRADGSRAFGDPALARASAQAATEGLKVDPRNSELKALLGR